MGVIIAILYFGRLFFITSLIALTIAFILEPFVAPADAHPLSALPGQFRGLLLRPGAALRHRHGRLLPTRRPSTMSCPNTGSASATSSMASSRRSPAWRTRPTRSWSPPASASEEERRRQQEQAAAGRARRAQEGRRPSAAPARSRRHSRGPHSRGEHAHRRLSLLAPELALPGPVDGVVRPLPGLFHAQLARPHQSQLPAVLPRRRPPDRRPQPAGHRRYGARLRGRQLRARPDARHDQLRPVLDPARALSRRWSARSAAS